ncbi:hypothetical protein L208DRAFT_1281176 [Tricholoma matsutake]|nr:hypothetical protein L208DRAFT_1281176 [Tricholoma matsutake 945]
MHLTRGPEPLTPFIIAHSKENVYCILLLTPCVPGLVQTRSSRDIILPPPEAFSPLNTSVSPTYPAFHTQNCTWNAVLSLVQQLHLLWTGYALKNLGEYADIKSLWQAWEEGMSVEGIGCMPPLRVIDEHWGSCKGHRAVWRPQGDAPIWVNFYFFITQINAYRGTGHTIDEAITYFEAEQGDQSVNQFHKSLQEKKPNQKRTIEAVA